MASTPLISIVAVDSRPMVLTGLANLIDARWPLTKVVGLARDYAKTIELTELLRPEVVLFSFFPDPMDGMGVLETLIDRCGAKVLLLKGRGESAPIGRQVGLATHGVVFTDDSADSIVQAIIKVSHLEDENEKVWLGGLAQLVTPTRSRAQQHDSDYDKVAKLTARERALVRALVANPSGKYMAIGATLGISEHTVHNHLTSIYQKLDLVNRIELLVYAVKHKLGGTGYSDSVNLE